MAQNADIQISAISALKIFADMPILKKSADIADTDINIGTSLEYIACALMAINDTNHLKTPPFTFGISLNVAVKISNLFLLAKLFLPFRDHAQSTCKTYNVL